MQRVFNGLGWSLSVVGFCFIFALDPLLGEGDALTPFDQVERRIPGGALMGLGFVMVRVRSLKPVLLCFILSFGWLSMGLLVSRLIGLGVVGVTIPNQWMWVGVEAAIILLAYLFARRRIV